MRISENDSNLIIATEIGKRIRDMRIANNYTQEELSEKSGVSLSTIARAEKGDLGKVENLINILRALRVLGNMELLIQEQTIVPTRIADNIPIRKRASRKRKTEKKRPVWGDEM